MRRSAPTGRTSKASAAESNHPERASRLPGRLARILGYHPLMPFAGYDDFDDCVAQNQDKNNPEAYCASIERAVLDADGKDAEAIDEAVTVAAPRVGRPWRFEIQPVFADLDGDGIDDETGEPVEEPMTPEIEPNGNGADFRALLVVEGVWTGDGRWIEEGALSWRDLPLPLMATDRTTEGHLDAILIGTFDEIVREGREVYGLGGFVESDDPEVLRLQSLIAQGALRGISVDLDSVSYDVVIPKGYGDDEDMGWGDKKKRMDDDGNELVEMDDYKIRITSARIMGATAVPFPAFEEAFIETLAAVTAALETAPEVTGWVEAFQSYDDIDFVPPKGAREEADRGLEWRREFGRGGTQVGVARARDISNGATLSPDTVRRMRSYFARHEVDKQADGWNPGEDGYPSAGRIAWALWGGDPGQTWAEKVVRQMSLRDEAGSMTAAGHPIEPPICPPANWYANPNLDAATPMTITDDGRVFGHVALWGQCHIGFSDQCVTPPRSLTNYAHFLTGEILCDDGSRFPVGQITIDAHHAPLNANAARAAAHYDHTGAAVADVTVGEDSHGIWCSGSLRPGVEPERIRALMASDVSGDWRRVGRGLELVAVLAVNVPGFGKARVRQEQGLVAALIAFTPHPVESDDLLRRAAERIAASIGRSRQERVEALRNRIKNLPE